MSTVIKNKLVLKDLGEPAMVKTMEGANAKYVLGTIYGIASAVKRRADKADPTKMHESLAGSFEGVPADPKLDTVSSGTLYLPEGIQNMISTKLEGENAANSVQFAFEICTVKATNAAGYAWAVTPIIKAEEGDPLDAMRTAIAAQKQAQLEAPKTAAKTK